MAALNMSHELIKSREEQRQAVEVNLRRLGQKIDQSLARNNTSKANENSSSS